MSGGQAAVRPRRAPGALFSAGSIIVLTTLAVFAALPNDLAFSAWLTSYTPKGSAARKALAAPRRLLTTGVEFAVLGAGVLLLAPRAQRWPRVAAYVATIAACTALVQGLKFVFGRARPAAAGAGDFTWWGYPGGLDAFPSGHAMHAFLFAALAGLYLPWTRWVLFPLAALAALSRVATRDHFLADLIAGAGLAVLGAALAVALFGRAAFTLGPRGGWRTPAESAPTTARGGMA